MTKKQKKDEARDEQMKEISADLDYRMDLIKGIKQPKNAEEEVWLKYVKKRIKPSDYA